MTCSFEPKSDPLVFKEFQILKYFGDLANFSHHVNFSKMSVINSGNTIIHL
jgi:hypothetical protein